MKDDIKKQIAQLRKLINEHNNKYYVLNSPAISDTAYDKLFRQLKQLEQANPELITAGSPTQKVGGKSDAAKTAKHSIAMLSIDNTYNYAEIREFDKRVAKILETRNYKYILEPKIDGLAVSLKYEKGKLTLAATRGDGKVGDIVTDNIYTIKSIPHNLKLIDSSSGCSIPDVLEVRGEVYMPIKAFERLNRDRAETSQKLFANPRNAAAGSLKLLDSATAANRGLAFFAYSVGYVSEEIAVSHYQMLDNLRRFSLPVNTDIFSADTIDQVLDYCQQWHQRRYQLDYMIDGIVIKVDDFEQQKTLGSTSRAPRWCIAYKFPAQQAQTTVESVQWQVGKTAVITPVANLTPVKLAGTVVKRASLHNFDEIQRLGLSQGDEVIIEKAGEIIPKIVKVVKTSPESTAIMAPEKCPICNSDTEKDAVYYRCTNPACPAVLREKLIYFAGKGQMDIDTLGPALIDQLIDKGLVRNFTDLYKLKFHQVAELNRMADKSAAKLLDAIEASKTRPLSRFITALGINNVGSETAEILAREFGSLEKLAQADIDRLCQIDQIGDVMANGICQFFRNPENIAIIKELISLGVKPSTDKSAVKDVLRSKVFVITGTLENFTRRQIQQMIKDNNGVVSSSLSGKTDFLIAGKNAGSKLTKAKTLGVKIISESDFIKMLGD